MKEMIHFIRAIKTLAPVFYPSHSWNKNILEEKQYLPGGKI